MAWLNWFPYVNARLVILYNDLPLRVFLLIIFYLKYSFDQHTSTPLEKNLTYRNFNWSLSIF